MPFINVCATSQQNSTIYMFTHVGVLSSKFLNCWAIRGSRKQQIYNRLPLQRFPTEWNLKRYNAINEHVNCLGCCSDVTPFVRSRLSSLKMLFDKQVHFVIISMTYSTYWAKSSSQKKRLKPFIQGVKTRNVPAAQVVPLRHLVLLGRREMARRRQRLTPLDACYRRCVLAAAAAA